MKTKGINRVVMVVKDFDKAVALYSELLNTTFYPVTIAEEDMGVRAAISYEAGIEIASPIPGSNEPWALVVAQQLKEHGESLRSVVFSVDDVEQARAKAQEMGIRVSGELKFDQNEVKRSFHDRFSTFIEYMLNSEDTHGAGVALGQF